MRRIRTVHACQETHGVRTYAKIMPAAKTGPALLNLKKPLCACLTKEVESSLIWTQDFLIKETMFIECWDSHFCSVSINGSTTFNDEYNILYDESRKHTIDYRNKSQEVTNKVCTAKNQPNTVKQFICVCF